MSTIYRTHNRVSKRYDNSDINDNISDIGEKEKALSPIIFAAPILSKNANMLTKPVKVRTCAVCSVSILTARLQTDIFGIIPVCIPIAFCLHFNCVSNPADTLFSFAW